MENQQPSSSGAGEKATATVSKKEDMKALTRDDILNITCSLTDADFRDGEKRVLTDMSQYNI